MFSKTKIALSAAMVLSTAFPASQLEKEWSTFTTADKTDCVSLANTGGESSYTELITCMEMARDVRKLHSDANSLSEQNIPSAPVGHRQPTAQ